MRQFHISECPDGSFDVIEVSGDSASVVSGIFETPAEAAGWITRNSERLGSIVTVWTAAEPRNGARRFTGGLDGHPDDRP
jgi:hypothetical protein